MREKIKESLKEYDDILYEINKLENTVINIVNSKKTWRPLIFYLNGYVGNYEEFLGRLVMQRIIINERSRVLKTLLELDNSSFNCISEEIINIIEDE